MSDWPFGDLMPFKYGAVLADCPWKTEMRSDAGLKKSPERHYPTMSEEELCALPVGQLAAPNCALFMWARWGLADQAMRVMAAWGFTFKSGGAWHKVTATGKTTMGTGYIFRDACEPYLVGTIGAPKYRSRSVRNLIVAERREHSRKPVQMRENIEKLLPDVWRCELFAREPWPGADVWGNETTKFGEAP